MKPAAATLSLTTPEAAWHLSWVGGRLRTTGFVNRLSGLRFNLGAVDELALVFSAALDRVAEPLLRLAAFKVVSVKRRTARHAVFTLRSAQPALQVALHVELTGPTRRKWVEVTNASRRDLLLLDAQLDAFTTEASTSGGGSGQPVYLEDEVFAAIEYPSADNLAAAGRVTLTHFPGRCLAPGATWRSHVALVSVAPAGRANAHFLDYLEAHSRPRPPLISVYTPFGINNQWGANPTLADEETLDVLAHLKQLRRHGVAFDYFTLDTGWTDFSSDLTRFRPTSYPHGPEKVIAEIRALRMKFGLWFATSWGLQSCWNYPAAFPHGQPPAQKYREGYPLGAAGVDFCLGEENYFSILKRAVLHHVRTNHVRFLKFDGGYYHCDNPDHGHLPGKYATEAMHGNLIDIAASARALAPDVFVMWYWGLRSPFWALHGDAIFESGLQMEGSGTSNVPTLYYRDSVTLAQDQNAQVARNIPPRLKDSLGVWLSNSRWGNFMGAERWRESLVMDLGRGSRLFPNIWSNLRELSDDDQRFLGWITTFARRHARLFRHRHLLGGDPFHNDVYGYAYGRGPQGLLFAYNDHFAARRLCIPLDASAGLDGRPGAPVEVVAHFPEAQRLRRPDGTGFRLGDSLDLWLRPFETLLLEVRPRRAASRLPWRTLPRLVAADLGSALELRPTAPDPRLDMVFADAEAFAQKGLQRKTYTFEATLGALDGPQPILAVVIRLRQGVAEWKYAPTVVQIVQTLARVGDRHFQLIPVPDGRQHGNTQSYGCSWVVYKVRLDPRLAHQPLQVAVHANLPADVEAVTEAWVVKRWWRENPRPVPDGYYTYAPS
ncbi:MAG: hypothetical protein ACHQ4G_04265 [Opitutales bacterium]